MDFGGTTRVPAAETMQAQDLTTARNTLTQPMQDQSLEFTAHLDVRGMKDGVHSGLAMFERSASGLMIVEENGRRRLSFFQKDGVQEGPLLIGGSIELRVRVEGDSATYSYSLDEGHTFQHLGSTVAIKFKLVEGLPALTLCLHYERCRPEWICRFRLGSV